MVSLVDGGYDGSLAERDRSMFLFAGLFLVG